MGLSKRRRAGLGSLAAFVLAGAPPAIGAGLETVGYEWAEWTGPYQIAFGIFLALAGIVSGAYALGIDGLFRTKKQVQSSLASSGKPLDAGFRLRSAAEVGRAVYEALPDESRASIRRMVAHGEFGSIEEYNILLVVTGAANVGCGLVGRWERGLPLERIDPNDLLKPPSISSILSTKPRSKPFDLCVDIGDASRIVAFYKDDHA